MTLENWKQMALSVLMGFGLLGIFFAFIRVIAPKPSTLKVAMALGVLAFLFMAFYISPVYNQRPLLVGVQWALFGLVIFCWQQLKQHRGLSADQK
jgi:hypothetical protein